MEHWRKVGVADLGSHPQPAWLRLTQTQEPPVWRQFAKHMTAVASSTRQSATSSHRRSACDLKWECVNVWVNFKHVQKIKATKKGDTVVCQKAPFSIKTQAKPTYWAATLWLAKQPKQWLLTSQHWAEKNQAMISIMLFYSALTHIVTVTRSSRYRASQS